MVSSNSKNSCRGHVFPIFTHVHKTAGTTLNSIIWRQYRKSEVLRGTILDLNSVDQTFSENLVHKRKKIILGHLGFGIHQFLSFPFNYFTLLRDPVKRTISHYYYYNSQDCKRFDLPTMSWEEFCEKLGDNLTERFDESLLVLRKLFGWNNIYYVRQNKRTQTRPALSNQVINLIHERNLLDRELYDYVDSRLTSSASKILGCNNDGHELMLRRFQQHNQYWGPVVSIPSLLDKSIDYTKNQSKQALKWILKVG